MALLGGESAHQVRGPSVRAGGLERGPAHVLLNAVSGDGREGLRLLTSSPLEVLEAGLGLGA